MHGSVYYTGRRGKTCMLGNGMNFIKCGGKNEPDLFRFMHCASLCF